MDPKLRTFVENQIQEFRNSDSSTCCHLCSVPLTKVHIDHVIHLAKLVNDYNIFFGPRTADDEYAYYAGWIEYHRQHALLRKTCPTCNLRRPKWSTTKPTCALCNNIERLNEDGLCAPCDNKCT